MSVELKELSREESDARFENEMAQIWSPHVMADAERYRYLRDRAGNAILDELAAESRPAQWDAIVDEYRGVQMGDGSVRNPEGGK